MKEVASTLLLVSFCVLFVSAANAQTVNGNINAAFAVGKWKESHEGVSIFCVRVTTPKDVTNGNSSAVCFLTEAQGKAKDSVTVATNTYAVTHWDDHGVLAMTEFYMDKNGDQTNKSTPEAVKIVFRISVNFDAHQVTKFVEANTGSTVGYHLEDQ